MNASPNPGKDPRVRCHGMKANPIGYLWPKYECFLTTGCQDIDFKKTLTKCDGNGTERERVQPG